MTNKTKIATKRFTDGKLTTRLKVKDGKERFWRENGRKIVRKFSTPKNAVAFRKIEASKEIGCW